ncbi:MAG: GDP-L-fucose synthase [Proteobacteria bacterium]|nr:GDP-L-fucose synthase [Pseudomonadota bacterium]MBQ4359468.1 GDP-L-fucose synthase [Pseudomonadota bacterium]
MITDKNTKIYVAGHRGLVGSAICRRLRALGFENLVMRTHGELDLTLSDKVDAFFASERPEVVVLAAAHVGGIKANSTYPADFILQNIAIQSSVINAALKYDVKRFLFLGSSCIYPRECPQPIREEYLLTSALEPTNEPYAIAKIAGLKMCEAINRQYGRQYLAVMPTNLYGPGDNYDLVTSHVVPAVIRRLHEAKLSGAKQVMFWGTGRVRREFLYVDDMADACIHLLLNTDHCELTNIGTGEDMTIRELIELVAKVVGYEGEIAFDHVNPDGTPQKLLDISKLKRLGWTPKYSLEEGLKATYAAYLQEHAKK